MEIISTLNSKILLIISVENLLEAWREFVRGKRAKRDVQEFSLHLMDNIFTLHNDLKNKTYTHGPYQAFNISDPKPRNIHKASVRDRLLHHALYRKLYPFFDRTFIADSYSCRNGKGTHKAICRFRLLGNRVSKNIKKFFANIDHKILIGIFAQYIPDRDILWLAERVISSFETRPGVGLPLGNLTSQLLVNIYMNEFDQFMKHKLKAKYYIRYADDFVIFSQDKERLKNLVRYIVLFLREQLHLQMHPDKVFIKTLASGVDFLGWVHFSDHRVLRTTTKRRMLKRLRINKKQEVVQSYLGMISHGNTQKLQERVRTCA